MFFFAGVLFSDKYAIPWDMIDYYYPSQFYSTESIKNGSLPFWNPHILSGFPALADPENAVFYPLNIVLYLFSLSSPLSLKALETFLALHYFLTGLFMWIFLRSLPLKRLSCSSCPTSRSHNGEHMDSADSLLLPKIDPGEKQQTYG
jgi:hypothetical protein